MAAAGPVTLGCDACGARYDLPLQVALVGTSSEAVTYTLNIAKADAVLLTQWASAHRGPVAPLAA